MQILPDTAHARGAIHPQFYGIYQGVSVPSAARGGSLKDSVISLRVDALGLVLGAQLPGDDREWKLMYSADWLWAEEGQPCLLVRQSLRAFDYAYKLCLERTSAHRVRVTMTSNDAKPLGEFTRVEPTDKERAVWSRLDRIYRSNHRDVPLLGINRATSVIYSEAAAEKIEVLRDLFAEFRDLNDEHLERFEPLLAHALRDPVASVRLAALKVFARMPTASSVEYLADLARRSDLTPEVLDQFIRTLGLYLETVNRILERREALVARFGSEDLETAHRRSMGILYARDAAEIDLMIFMPRQRAWQSEHREMLRAALRTFAAHAPTDNLRGLAADVLRVFDPKGACELTLTTLRRPTDPRTPR